MRLVLGDVSLMLRKFAKSEARTHRQVRHPVLDRLENTFLLV